jgi:cysteine desulfuration protein SufE
MADIPQQLQEVLEDFEWIQDRTERTEYLIELADRFPEVKVPERIATQPYPEDHRVPHCESDAFVWVEENADGTLKFWFDVLNPQGLSAKAMSVVLDQSLSGQPLEQVAEVKPEIVFDLFGKNISMGKGQGLMGIVAVAQNEALKRLK